MGRASGCTRTGPPGWRTNPATCCGGVGKASVLVNGWAHDASPSRDRSHPKGSMLVLFREGENPKLGGYPLQRTSALIDKPETRTCHKIADGARHQYLSTVSLCCDAR